MARTKRGRRSPTAPANGAGTGSGCFPIRRPACFRSSGGENGRRLSRSLKHRDWARAKRQADEAAAGFAVHEPNGKAEAEPEPLTLGRLFEIYGEEVTPTKGERTRRRDRVAAAMFLDSFGRDRRPADTLATRLGPVHSSEESGQGRTLGPAGRQPDHRMGPDVL